MGKPGSGGGTNPNFDQSILGPPPGDLTVEKEHWIEIYSIPSGQRMWFGFAEYTAPDKSLTFELRTNNTGESLGDLASTSVLYKASVSPRKGTVTADMYKNGRLHIVSVVGTGSEKVWLRLLSKQQTLGSYLYLLTWTFE